MRAVKASLPLGYRVYECKTCGLIMDRDRNAARNILSVAESTSETLNGRRHTSDPRNPRLQGVLDRKV